MTALSDVQLEAASDAVNAMIFARPEDGAFNLKNKDQYFFVTTGEGTGNALGRLYELDLTGKDSTGPAKLTVAYNADQVIAGGGDIAISPDNIDVSRDYLMINEDGTATSRAVMAAKKRDGSIWRFDVDEDGIDVSSALRIAELNPPGRDRVPVGPGVWETSGIIDATDLFGQGHVALRRAGPPADRGAEAEHGRGRAAADARRPERQEQGQERGRRLTRSRLVRRKPCARPLREGGRSHSRVTWSTPRHISSVVPSPQTT